MKLIKKSVQLFATAAMILFALSVSTLASDKLIIEKQRIGPISLMMERSAAEKILGRPSSVRDEEGGVLIMKYDKEGFSLALGSFHGKMQITDITTSNPSYSTLKGIHPGSTVAEMSKAYGKPVRISTYQGVTYHQYSSITFRISGNRVSAVSISTTVFE